MLHDCFSDDFQHFRETNFDIFAKMYAQSSSPTIGEDLEISSSLRGFHDAERVLRAGHLHVVSVVASDLQEYPAVRAAFVRLSRGMQETRTEAETGGHLLGIANSVANLLQACFVLLVHLNVAKHGKVVAGLDAIEMRLQVPRNVAAAQCGRILRIGKELERALLKNWLLRRQRTGLLVFARQLAGLDLAGFDVRLIKGIDPNDR